VNADMIAEGYGVSLETFIESVTGSTTSSILECAVADMLGGVRMGSKQLPYDVRATNRKNKRIEVRNLCNSAASFAPSTAIGKGRFFEENLFYDKIGIIDSYVFCDLRDCLRTPASLFEIDASEVLDMYETVKAVGFDKKLRRNNPDYYMSDKASMTQNRFFERFPYEDYKLVA